MQIVAGVIPVSQLLNNSVMQTLLPGKTIKFYVTPNGKQNIDILSYYD